ncbi:MAG: DUF3881 family protein [Eubacteriales bacterium]|jgi:hypothetical protein
MHKFLGSVGFSKLNDLEDQDMLLQDVLSHYDYKKVTETEDHHVFAQISKEFAPDTGISVCGEYDADNLFHMEYYFPFFRGTQNSSYESIAVDRHSAETSFAGACEDARVGTTLIFYVSNAGEYISAVQSGVTEDRMNSVSFAALASEGMILFPLQESMKADTAEPAFLENRDRLFEAAQNGDQEAIRNLTMDDIDTIATLTHRIKNEDIYTIVDSYFMPYGMECDLYSVMGDITDLNTVQNHATGERIYQIGLKCNGVPLDICINEKDLTGVPAVGRRFKGDVWLQGHIQF